LSNVIHGEPPAIGYAQGYEYVSPDGTRTALPRGRGISAIAPYDGGLLVADTRYFEGTLGLAFVDTQGRRTNYGCSSGHPAQAEDEELVAWVTVPCPETGTVQPPATVYLGGMTQTTPDPLISVVGIVGDEVVYNGGFIGGVWTTDLTSTPRRIPGLVQANRVGADQGLVVGRTDSDGPSVVAKISSGQILWSTRDWELGAVSPDGRSVLGVQHGGNTMAAWAVFDARTGELQHHFALPAGFYVVQTEWEDNRHVLMVAVQGRSTAIIRADLDGTITRATPTVRAPAHAAGFVLSEQP
jgi:hypothetical protein